METSKSDTAKRKEDEARAADAKKKDEEAKAAARRPTVSASTAGELAGNVVDMAQRIADLERKHEAADRAAFLASRPDLPADLVKVLQNKPLAEVKEIVAAVPKKAAPKPAATATVPATRGAEQGDENAPRLPPAEAEALRAQMGLTRQTHAVVSTPRTLVLGASVSAEPASSNPAGQA